MDLDGKVAILHTVGGSIFGLLTNYVYLSGLGFFSGLAALLFMIFGLLITGHITAFIFGRESMNEKQWLGSGVVPFFFTWVVFWVLKYNGAF